MLSIISVWVQNGDLGLGRAAMYSDTAEVSAQVFRRKTVWWSSSGSVGFLGLSLGDVMAELSEVLEKESGTWDRAKDQRGLVPSLVHKGRRDTFTKDLLS